MTEDEEMPNSREARRIEVFGFAWKWCEISDTFSVVSLVVLLFEGKGFTMLLISCINFIPFQNSIS